jgi:hypothetical protein
MGQGTASLFFDPVRLTQELEQEARLGRPFIGEPGLIVVPEVTRKYMETAARTLADEGFFTVPNEILRNSE